MKESKMVHMIPASDQEKAEPTAEIKGGAETSFCTTCTEYWRHR